MDESRKEVEKLVEETVTRWTTLFITAAITIVIMVVVLKFVWAWVVPDLFPGAVTQGLINAELTWLAAVKFAVLVSVVSGVYRTLIDVFNPGN